MSGPLMIPRDNYSCDIVRGVPGNMSHYIMSPYDIPLSCPRRTVGGAGPPGEARSVLLFSLGLFCGSDIVGFILPVFILPVCFFVLTFLVVWLSPVLGWLNLRAFGWFLLQNSGRRRLLLPSLEESIARSFAGFAFIHCIHV